MARGLADLRSYTVLAWTWLRCAAQYPVSMVMLALATAIVGALDLAVIVLMFAQAPRIAGFTAPEALFLYGTSSLSFAVADILLGGAERLGQHVRQGTLDAMLVRPVGPLVQIAAEEFSPRRLGKLIPALAVMVLVLPRLEVSWTPLRTALVPVMVVSGVVIFASLWVLTAAVQFVVLEGHQATKSVTYGGGYLTQYPLSVFGRDFAQALTFVLPLAFVNWQPALYVLERPDPLGLPAAARFASPAVAAVLCVIAALAWRSGLRHYRSTGS